MPIDQLEVILDNPAVRDALSVVYERSDEGSDELEWRDVRDALSSQQWGRLIEEGVLVGAGTGFAVANPERVESALEAYGETERPASELEPVRWATVDKAAGAFVLVLFAGYWSTTLQNAIASVENVVLAPVTEAVPFYAVILLLAVVTGLYSTVLQRRLTDREKLEAYQRRLSELRERMQAARERDDEETLERLEEEQRAAAADQLGMMKLQFRPTVWIMLLTIPVFLWLRWKVNGGHLGAGETGLVVPIAGAVSWQESLVGPMPTWIVWYFLGSMASRQFIQKALNVQTGTSS